MSLVSKNWCLQLRQPLDPDDDAVLDLAIDKIRDTLGPTAITRAVLLGRAPGLAVPLLPH